MTTANYVLTLVYLRWMGIWSRGFGARGLYPGYLEHVV